MAHYDNNGIRVEKGAPGSIRIAASDAHEGISLRDWFAGKALIGLPTLCAHDTLEKGETFPQHVAKSAYELADAILAAREVKS